MRRALLFSLLIALITAAAARPSLHDADLRSLGTPSPGLAQAFESLLENTDGLVWAGYSLPIAGDQRTICCGGRCSLERKGGTTVLHRDTVLHRNTVNLTHSEDGSQTMQVMLRVNDHRLTEIRIFSDDCQVDAGGLPVFMWDGIDSRQSLELLLAQAGAAGHDLGEDALVAIAHHAGSEVDRVLEDVARGKRLARLEEEAIFWLGEARGSGGFEALERLRRDLRETDLREQIAFALHLSDAPGALPALIDMARHDGDSGAREQALFWLSQEAGQQAAAAIAEAGEEDPDQEVKEAAIFALSQLPPERGVPLLIRYAENHANGEVRKKAIFWLGQSEDPRALEFFERVLTR